MLVPTPSRTVGTDCRCLMRLYRGGATDHCTSSRLVPSARMPVPYVTVRWDGSCRLYWSLDTYSLTRCYGNGLYLDFRLAYMMSALAVVCPSPSSILICLRGCRRLGPRLQPFVFANGIYAHSRPLGSVHSAKGGFAERTAIPSCMPEAQPPPTTPHHK